MDKPFTIKVQETEQEIVKIVNNSKLPAYVLKTIFQNLYNQIENIDNEEIKKYADSLKENSDETKTGDKND